MSPLKGPARGASTCWTFSLKLVLAVAGVVTSGRQLLGARPNSLGRQLGDLFASKLSCQNLDRGPQAGLAPLPLPLPPPPPIPGGRYRESDRRPVGR